MNGNFTQEEYETTRKEYETTRKEIGDLIGGYIKDKENPIPICLALLTAASDLTLCVCENLEDSVEMILNQTKEAIYYFIKYKDEIKGNKNKFYVNNRELKRNG